MPAGRLVESWVRARPRRKNSGYTIIEVVLVIALMVALAAILWPNAVALMEGDRLPRTGDDFRGLLTGLRLRSMDEGRTFTLSMTQGSANYSIASDEQQAAPAPEEGQTVVAPGATQNSAFERSVVDFDSQEVFGQHVLANRLRFESETSTARNAGAATTTGNQQADGSGIITIRFQPDGTCDDAAFWIVDDTGVGIRFEIRGLTGVVKVGRPRNFAGQP